MNWFKFPKLVMIVTCLLVVVGVTFLVFMALDKNQRFKILDKLGSNGEYIAYFFIGVAVGAMFIALCCPKTETMGCDNGKNHFLAYITDEEKKILAEEALGKEYDSTNSYSNGIGNRIWGLPCFARPANESMYQTWKFNQENPKSPGTVEKQKLAMLRYEKEKADREKMLEDARAAAAADRKKWRLEERAAAEKSGVYNQDWDF